MKYSVLASFIVLTLAMLACSLGTSGSGKNMTIEELQAAFDKLPAGDAPRGARIFQAQACHICHVDQSIGPAFPGDPPLATIAGTRKSGYSAELYLYESIVEPNAYVVPGFQKDIMPNEFGDTLSDQELADLIAYLMTMK